MKKNLLSRLWGCASLILGLFVSAQLAQAQVIKNGVLESWVSASGDIKIPDEVVEIAPNCFYSSGDDGGGGWYDDFSGERPALRDANNSITSINFNNVRKIGKEAIKECIGLKSVLMPNVEEIGESAFEGCSNITTITLPKVTQIGKSAFASMSALTSCTIGGPLSTMGDNPFYNNTSLKTLVITNSAAQFVAENNVIMSKDKTKALCIASNEAEVTLADEVTSIANKAAQNLSNLKVLRAKNVTEIGEFTLANCSSLQALYLPKLTSVGLLCFNGVSSLALFDIHESTNVDQILSNKPEDTDLLTIYVANEAIKKTLSNEYKSAKIVVGAPKDDVQTYTVSFKANPADAATFESWTSGARDINSGEALPQSSVVTIKANVKLLYYEFDHWEVNGKRVNGTEANPAMLVINELNENIDVVAFCNRLPEGNNVFFASSDNTMGTVTATVDGKSVKSASIVPTGKTIVFTATPKEGYKVGDWKLLGEDKHYTAIDSLTGKTTWSVVPTETIDIIVDFSPNEGKVRVKFDALGGNGTLTARVKDGEAISNNATVYQGKTIIFTATPNEGYVVDTWFINDSEVKDSNNEYVLENIQYDTHVSVAFEKKGSDERGEHDPVIENNKLIKWNAVGDVTIPSTVEEIADYAFNGATELTGVTIPASVKKIGLLPFRFCGELKKLVVDANNPHFVSKDNIIYSKDETLLVQYAPAKTEETFTLPANLKDVKNGAFTFAMGLKKIEGSTETLKTVDGMLIRKADNALLHFPSAINPALLSKVVALPEDIRSLAQFSLAYNFVISKMQLPAALETINDMACIGCSNLTELKMEHCKALKVVGKQAFKDCFKLTSFEPSAQCKLEKIETLAFNNTALAKVVLPEGVKIAENVFKGCQSIAQVISYSQVPPTIEQSAFNDIEDKAAAILFVPDAAVDAYKQAAGWNVFTNIQGISTMAAQAPLANDVLITPVADGLRVQAPVGAHISLFSLNGTMLQQATSQGNTYMQVPAGCYIVRVDYNGNVVISKAVR